MSQPPMASKRLPKCGRPQDSSPMNKREKKHKEIESNCSICQEVIIEGEEGHDAIFCEGHCQSWIHRKCSGLTNQVFEKICKSDNVYMCPFCMLSIQNSELVELRNIVKSLNDKLEKLSDKLSSGICKDSSIESPPVVETNLTNDTSSITATVTCLFNEEKERESGS